MESNVLITFDIDGTLIRSVGISANKLHKLAFSHAFLHLFGIDGTIDAIKHHGSTDLQVALRTLEHYGVPREKVFPRLNEVSECMLEYALEHSNEISEGLEILPGVKNLLQILSKNPRVVTGLVTGNLQEIAWLKMEGLGIKEYFSVPNFGGFGSDHLVRGELIKISAERAKKTYDNLKKFIHIHVGDTPADITAAEYGNAIPIGVCTGVFSREELANSATNPDHVIILDDLTNLDKFLECCGLK